jgi:hypothetical protein
MLGGCHRLPVERLRRLEPDDVVVKLSLTVLLLEASPGDRNVLRKVVRLAEGIENETPVHTALLFYKAKALHGLGLLDASRDTLTGALRRKKDRSGDLLRAIRYEQIQVLRISVSTTGCAVNSKSCMPKRRIMRMWLPAWDCRRWKVPKDAISTYELIRYCRR